MSRKIILLLVLMMGCTLTYSQRFLKIIKLIVPVRINVDDFDVSVAISGNCAVFGAFGIA